DSAGQAGSALWDWMDKVFEGIISIIKSLSN
ncbi:MAG: hypothetical protein JWR85_2835, partial [Marmoricola sp.]|nr:hypothetical protein [Marmoricola sp.]